MTWMFVFILLATLSPAVFGTLVGGLTPVELKKDEGARKALEFAVPELNKMSNSMFLFTPQQVIKVEKQVVQGTMYHFTVRMVRTSCRKTPDLHQCPVPIPANSEAYICTFKVWCRPWLKNKLDKIRLLDPKCDKEN